MKPVVQEVKISRRLWFLYLIIFIICVAGIGISLYMQYYQEQNIGAIFGISDEDSEEQDEYDSLKSEFSSIFTNQVEILQEEVDVEKINSENEIIYTIQSYEKNDDNCILNVEIPYININNDIIKEYNQEISEIFKDKAESIIDEESTTSVIYNVRYKAYLQDNILSLVIEAELKEWNKSQRIIIKTYNYDLVNKKEITLEELLEIKDIDVSSANSKIKEEIEEIQEQNDALAEQGYTLYARDVTSDIYAVENTENYFLGENGMLYVVYAYGNENYTSEMDIIIFK